MEVFHRAGFDSIHLIFEILSGKIPDSGLCEEEIKRDASEI